MAKNQSVKLPKGVDETFIDSIQAMSVDELKAVIVTLQLQNDENEAFKDSPEFLAAKEEFDHHKDRFDLVAGPVRDTTTTIKNKTKLVIARLKDKGAA